MAIRKRHFRYTATALQCYSWNYSHPKIRKINLSIYLYIYI